MMYNVLVTGSFSVQSIHYYSDAQLHLLLSIRRRPQQSLSAFSLRKLGAGCPPYPDSDSNDGVDGMLPRCSPLLLVATAVGLLIVVHFCIMMGGAPREAAVAFCAFVLLIGTPIVVLAWFGSITDQSKKSRQRHLDYKRQKSEAALWQKTLLELQTAAQSEHRDAFAAGSPSAPAQAPACNVASAPDLRGHPRKHATGRALTGVAMVASALGLMGCYSRVPAANWAMIHPGMGTAELISLVGAPENIRSDGTAAVWQYCRDFFGRNADYYMAVMVDGETVRNVQPYPVFSDAGCEDFYRADF